MGISPDMIIREHYAKAKCWNGLLENQLVIFPFIAYEKWFNGKYIDDNKVGVRYVVMEMKDTRASLDSKQFSVESFEDFVDDVSLVGETPDEAYEKYLDKHAERRGIKRIK